MQDDVHPVRAARDGDEAAFDLIVGRYYHRILRHAHRLLEDWDAAQDVAQDTFARAYEALPRQREDAALVLLDVQTLAVTVVQGAPFRTSMLGAGLPDRTGAVPLAVTGRFSGFDSAVVEPPDLP
ncbi:MAG TPA: sigma factor [Dehalococcoidia bacterium]